MIDFVNLHNHSHFSILDSLISPEALITRAKELGQKAVALTDHGSLTGVWEAYNFAKKAEIKLIVGVEMYFLDDVKNTEQRFRHVLLLAKNAVGYRNLLTLNKKGYDNSIIFTKRVYPLIDWKLLEEHAEGLICLTSCGNGIISQLLMNKNMEEAENQLNKLINIFGKDNLGLEVQAHNLKRGKTVYNDPIEQAFINNHTIRLAKKYELRAVATTNAHYLHKEDAETHDVLLAIGSFQPVYSNFRLKYDSQEFYMKTGEQVKSFFERNYGDYAETLCANSVYFADLCEEPEWIDPKFSNPSGKELPVFPVKDQKDYVAFQEWLALQDEFTKNLSEDKSYLRFKCFPAFEEFKKTLPEEKHKLYLDRILDELDTLEYHGFSSYMLIVADYLDWCRDNNIPVGVGRGSVAGCFVAYLLKIHSADSIKYGLIFERFHNKEKKSYPDIDVDVSTDNRGRVIQYLINKYGDNRVAGISNYNLITPKVYLRDLSRSLELGGSREDAVKIGNDLAGMINKDVAKYNSFSKVLEATPLLSEYCKKYPTLSNHASIMDLPRNASSHAAGVVISERPLTGLVPLRRDKDGALVMEFEKDNTEACGMVKMDVLGLSSLDRIETIISLIKENNHPFNNEHLDYDADDEKTYDLITRGDVFGVFQLGTSGGTIELCKRVKPKNIEDLAVITTLARPASANIRNDYISTRDGLKKFSVLHSSLEGAFQKTLGFGLYDESILQLGRDVAGWTYNEADRIRKMIKEKGKHPEKERKLREEFIQGAMANGIHEIMAPRIWDEEIKKFAGYTFNKSHAVVYSMVSYQMAYLKAHYPIEFLLGNLMSEIKSLKPDRDNNIAKSKKEIKQHHVKILPPDINRSKMVYSFVDDKSLITGLDALKFVSDDAIEDIISKRPFKDFNDFMVRVDSKKVRSNTIQALASSGSLDSFKIPRKLIYLYCSDYRKKLQTWLKKHDPNTETFNYPWPEEKDWTLPNLYALEKSYLGEGFCCGKKDAYGTFFKQADYIPISKLKNLKDKTPAPSIRGEVKDFFEFKVKKEGSKYYGMPMIKATIEDVNGEQCGITIFPDGWKKVQDRIKIFSSKFKFEPGVAIHFSGVVNIYENEFGLILDNLFNFSPNPPLPADLEAKKVNLKNNKKQDSGEKATPEELFEELEDEMYEEGHVDFTEEID